MGMRAGEAGEAPSGGDQRIGRSTTRRSTLSETRKYRKFTAQQKLELVMASWRGERSDRGAVPRARDLGVAAAALARAGAGGRHASASPAASSARRRASSASGSPSSSGRWAARPTSWRSLGNALRAGSERMRVARSRELAAAGHRPAVVARIAADQPPGDLPRPEATAGAGVAGAAAGRRGRGGDRRRGRGQPDRRLPAGHGVGAAAARPAGQPQAGAARDARARG